MRLVVSVFAVAAVVAGCAKDPYEGGGPETGGVVSTGGKTSTGGVVSTGGKTSTGGVVSTGGKVGTGGVVSTGGKVSTGGVVSTGGKVSTGGVVSTGGTTGTGGVIGTGGTTKPLPPINCPDTSGANYKIDQQYGNGVIEVSNNANKNYNFMSNWWSMFSNQTETISGLGFTLSNPNGASSSNDNPMGFPSMFIGSYRGKGTKGSNLPKLVSTLTSVPTIFHTNATSLDTSDFNATYDVWFTSNNSLVSGSDPGGGGAYLMVWLFKPSKRQPRGSIALDGYKVPGVPGSWAVWYDDATNPPCVSYVSTSPISDLDFDLNGFIQDAVGNQWGVTSSQYLSIIFAGTEVWGGANGFQIKQFCASVQ
jgi:hypothetical protein